MDDIKLMNIFIDINIVSIFIGFTILYSIYHIEESQTLYLLLIQTLCIGLFSFYIYKYENIKDLPRILTGLMMICIILHLYFLFASSIDYHILYSFFYLYIWIIILPFIKIIYNKENCL
jgi:hypothetical protein